MGKKKSSILFVINFYKNIFFHIHYFFVLTYFVFIFQVTAVLSIVGPATPPFQKVFKIYHVINVIICSTNDVHCNACRSKSKVHKSSFL
jgi:hypothetical protein